MSNHFRRGTSDGRNAIGDAGVLYGVAAKTARGRDRLRRNLALLLPKTFPRALDAWWVDPEFSVAFHAPVVARRQLSGGSHAAMALAGAIRAPPPVDLDSPPAERSKDADPEQTFACAGLLRHFCRRDLAALPPVRGEFALAFWDGSRARLVLARDHLGQRGLFFVEGEELILFCSNLEPLLANPNFECALDVESAFHYLAVGRPVPGRTLARGVARVPAAHALVWEAPAPPQRWRYYTPLSDGAQRIVDEALRRRIAKTLDEAIAARLGGQPQALLLSGGVDSSYIAATASALGASEKIEAYTIEFMPHGPYNECEYARLVAQAAHIRHHIVQLWPREVGPVLEEVLASPEPCSAQATVTHLHLLARIGRDGRRDLISGLGADEVFGGYQHFLDAYFVTRKYQKRWSAEDRVEWFDGLLWNARASRESLFAGVARFFEDSALSAALLPPYRHWEQMPHLVEFYRDCRRIKRNAHPFEMIVAHECAHRIPDLLFVDFETVGRRLGFRTVYPFLDPDVVTLACGLGPTARYWREGRWRNKKTLREIASSRVPATILNRRPMSYNAPFMMWMRAPGFAKATFARLHRSRFWEVGLVRREWLERLRLELDRETRRKRPTRFPDQLWALLTLASWYDRWVDKRP